jgi:hypothetical protein
MNPAWQDLAEDWGERIKLQIPHFVRDDNIKNREEDSKPEETNTGAARELLQSRAKTNNA